MKIIFIKWSLRLLFESITIFFTSSLMYESWSGIGNSIAVKPTLLMSVETSNMRSAGVSLSLCFNLEKSHTLSTVFVLTLKCEINSGLMLVQVAGAGQLRGRVSAHKSGFHSARRCSSWKFLSRPWQIFVRDPDLFETFSTTQQEKSKAPSTGKESGLYTLSL